MPNDRYDHRRYAANQGDVWKHALLVEVLAALPGATRYFETHAGPGPVTLARGGEWERGLARIRAHARPTLYETLLKAHPVDTYPGSWTLAKQLVPSLAMTLCDLHERGSVLVQTDGYAALAEAGDQDLALVDPPFGRGSDDWLRLADAALTARCRAFLLWYPIFSPLKPDALVAARDLPGYELLWADLAGPVGFASKGAGVIAGGEAGRILADRTGMLEDLASRLGGRLNVRRRA